MMSLSMIVICSCFLGGELRADQYDHARSLAMCRSYTSLARGYQAIGINPANLALPGNGDFSVGLCAVGANLANNSFTLADYNKYNGAFLSQSDKDRLLASVPDDGLAGNASGVASLFSFAIKSFAFGVTGDGGGMVALPKDVVDLVLNGNTFGKTSDLSSASGSGVARIDISVSYARSLYTAKWGNINGGLTVKYIRGIGYFKVTESSGYFVTTPQGLSSAGSMRVISSKGGMGFGLDVGAATVYQGKYTVSFAITNAVSRIQWSKNNETNFFLFTAQELTPDNADADSTTNSEHKRQSMGSFTASLAPQMALGISRQYRKLLISADIKEGLRNSGDISTTPQLSVGCEWRLLSFLPLRTGISIGGAEKSGSGAGFGLVLGAFELDLGYAVTKSLIPIGGAGLGIAMAIGLRF